MSTQVSDLSVFVIALVTLGALILYRLGEIAGCTLIIDSHMILHYHLGLFGMTLTFIKLVIKIRLIFLHATLTRMLFLSRYIITSIFLGNLIRLILIGLIFLGHLRHSHHHNIRASTAWMTTNIRCMAQAHQVRGLKQ